MSPRHLMLTPAKVRYTVTYTFDRSTQLVPILTMSLLVFQGFDGNTYHLVFSDEFEVDGRSFFPGDDPYWEAVDLHYWGTGD